MFFPIKNIDEVAKEMKSFGEFLMQYSSPKVSQEDDSDVGVIKQREVTVDGYVVVIYYSKNDWPTHYMEVVQVTAKHMPFLPFSLVCKIGKKYLGDAYLSYVDYFRDNRKTYCWTVASDKENNRIPAPYKKEILSDDCVYEGLFYKCLNPSNKNS